MNETNPERMQCMEVWGGNEAVERSVQTAGLEIWVYNRPYGQAAGGGDVYYLSSCASGRITRMLLADTKTSDTVADIPLGILGDVSYRQFDVRLQPGDMVLSYSDALPESADADGRQLGQAGVLGLVRELAIGEASQVIPAIIDRITGLADGNLSVRGDQECPA